MGELVANASVHAKTSIRLIVSTADRWFEVAVRDQSADRPVLRPARTNLLHDLEHVRAEPVPADPHDPAWAVGPSGSVIAGRGLQIVAATSDRWGVIEFTGGKDVWFRLLLPSEYSPQQPCPCATGNRRTPGGLPLGLLPD